MALNNHLLSMVHVQNDACDHLLAEYVVECVEIILVCCQNFIGAAPSKPVFEKCLDSK